MKKRITAFVFVLLLCVLFTVPAFAQEAYPRFVDQADVLPADAEARVIALLDDVSEQYGVDVAAIIFDTLGGADAQYAADYYYEYCDFGFGPSHDGIMLLVSLEERDWYITGEGFGIEVLSGSGLDRLSDAFLSSLSYGNYEQALSEYADAAAGLISRCQSGAGQFSGADVRGAFPAAQNAGVSAIVGLLAALFGTGSMKKQLKSVHSQHAAGNYVRSGSMQVTHSREIFLYSNVNRTPKPQNNSDSSTHVSSSGRTHGGGGGKF